MNQHANDVIFYNAKVLTQDPDHPHAEAVVVQGSAIAYVGDNAGALDLRLAGAELIDAHGATVLPGFIDSHFHLLWGSLQLDKLQLATVENLEQLAAQLAAFAIANPELVWIEGVNLRYNAIPADRPLDREFLDRVLPDRPVILFAYDLHTAWANSAALTRRLAAWRTHATRQ